MTATNHDEMTCRELVELVTDYLEDRLATADRARFEAHVAACEYCATYVDQLRQTVRTLGRIPEESLSDEARDALLTAFRGWRRGRVSARRSASAAPRRRGPA